MSPIEKSSSPLGYGILDMNVHINENRINGSTIGLALGESNRKTPIADINENSKTNPDGNPIKHRDSISSQDFGK
jgi:hypothetical protein